jgi:hypothetical protein
MPCMGASVLDMATEDVDKLSMRNWRYPDQQKTEEYFIFQMDSSQ